MGWVSNTVGKYGAQDTGGTNGTVLTFHKMNYMVLVELSVHGSSLAVRSCGSSVLSHVLVEHKAMSIRL